ncbi:FCP1 domain containing protein [Trema orientale]|uniref:FCP1 domain containing protein n=1 Tax=Trema orientale TaxID=63057 RepID=A0A2P5BVZ1_TREOI|nr:FCP1 domain containing protein [Trema orientale]
MKGLKSKLLFAWDQNECTNSGFSTLENKHKPLFLKESNKLWQNKYLCRGQYSSSNTLLIDNKPYKALLNPPHTSIFTEHEYKVDDVDDVALGPKSELRLYLDELAEADDIPSFVKGHPFGQPAISPDHSDWNFYSKVVRRFEKST